MTISRNFLVLAAVLVSAAASGQQKFINPPGLSKPASYTQVVVHNKTIYVSGQVSANEKGEVVGKGDLKAQVTKVYENLKICLEAAGASFADVVKMNTYVVNLKPDDLAIIREVRKNYLPAENPPASTLVGVTALANPDYLIEVEAVAKVK